MSDGVPQFTTAEYAAGAGVDACKSCRQPISGAHYQVNGASTCSNCAGQIKNQMRKDSHPAFARGVLFGILAAFLGLVLYVTVALVTGLIIGFVSLAVGYMVGKAVVTGSGGLGGRRYQIAAVLLTYSAVSLSAIPIAISQQMKQRSAQQTQAVDAAEAPRTVNLGRSAAALVLIGLASPFLDLASPAHGIIGLIILFIGIRIAWRLTAARSMNILGPISDPAPTVPG